MGYITSKRKHEERYAFLKQPKALSRNSPHVFVSFLFSGQARFSAAKGDNLCVGVGQ